ncbi:MAG: YceI family protein [Bacteroidia bacterium]
MSTDNRTKWEVDPSHSEVQFKAKHLVISTVTGTFKSFNGEMYTEGDKLDNATVNFTIDVKSLDTNASDRDNHLKSDDFFNAEKHPQIKFRDGILKQVKGDEYKLKGKLTIRETTKDVELDVEHGGMVTDPYGQKKAGFEVNGSINRKEYGLQWNAVTEAGSVVVGDTIKMHINVQLVQKD